MRTILATLLAFGLLACTTIDADHGYVPTDRDLAAIRVGLDTRTTVATLVGRPGLTGVVDDSGWYYVRSEFETFAWRAPKEVDREVVAISFAPNGLVTNIERFGLEDGNVVRLSRRVTETNVRGIGFLEQLFRNLGNFDPGAFIDE